MASLEPPPVYLFLIKSVFALTPCQKRRAELRSLTQLISDRSGVPPPKVLWEEEEWEEAQCRSFTLTRILPGSTVRQRGLSGAEALCIIDKVCLCKLDWVLAGRFRWGHRPAKGQKQKRLFLSCFFSQALPRLSFKSSQLNSPRLFCVTDQLCILASASVGSRHGGTANTLHAEARGASVSVAATVSHLPGLLASSSVIMTIYRPSPLVPDVFVPHFCYDETQMSCVTHIWLLVPFVMVKERGKRNMKHLNVWFDLNEAALWSPT